MPTRRRFREVSARRWLVLAAMVVAAITATVVIVLVVRGPAPPRPYSATAPPVSLGANGSPPTPRSSVSAGPSPSSPPTPVTVRLVIPDGGINIPVIQGDGVTVPLHLAMHYPGTDQPGGGSNSLYYAHAQPGMFQGLYQIHPGSEIRAVRSDNSVVRYKAVTFKKVPYDERAVLAPTPYDEITLLTCTTYDPYTPRFVVIGLPG